MTNKYESFLVVQWHIIADYAKLIVVQVIAKDLLVVEFEQ